MSKGWKITIGVGVVLLILCGITCISMTIIGRYAVSRTITSQPEQAATIGHEIADYTLPSGYTETLGMSMFNLKSVIVASDNPETLVIMLMQFPANAEMSQEDMQREMSRSLAQQGQFNTSDLEVVDTWKVTIKGQQVDLSVRESNPEQGQAMRQVVGMFPGKSGPAMLMVMGDPATWDQAVLDAFLVSIR